jgi:ornithine decarboxylase
MNYLDLPDHLKKEINRLDTPFLLFDLDIISEKISLIKDSIQPDNLYYAVKCNSLPPILEAIASDGCGFEANNMAEVEKALRSGAKIANIINSSPKTPSDELLAMHNLGIGTFTFDSKGQIDNIAANAPKSKGILRIYTTNEGSGFTLNKHLGAAIEDAPFLLDYAKQKGIGLYGLTFHVGSQCHSPDNWKAGIDECAKLFDRFPEMSVLNIGGGLPVKYNKDIPSISDIAESISHGMHAGFAKKPKLIIEPGRFIVGDAAIAGTSIILIDEKEPVYRASVDLSVFCGLIEILENGDGFQYPIETDSQDKDCLYSVSGPTCAGSDMIVPEIMLPRLKVDYTNHQNSSRLFLCHVGAYTLDYVAAGRASGFNGAKIPKVYYLRNGVIHEM